MGLYNDPAGTRALFPGDRLLRTGEFGSLDGRGRLTVTGRRRNLLSFKSGKTVSPEELEILLAGIPYIGDAVVFAAGEAETGVERVSAPRLPFGRKPSGAHKGAASRPCETGDQRSERLPAAV